MRSPDAPARPCRDRSARARAAVLARALALGAALGCAPPVVGAHDGATAAARALPARAVVADAVEALRRDPDLQETEVRKTLRWKHPDAEADKPPPDASAWSRFLAWLAGAVQWLANAGRWLVWLLGALAVALLAVSLRRWVRERGELPAAAQLALPSRVGALDVRPETLPDDIGAAARRLWLDGAHRAALSLLYRGALSRLIHVHAVPIRAANTEAECLRLARGSLAPERSAFFGRLVVIWQLAVYGAHDPDGAGVLALCDDFDRLLGGTPTGDAA